MFEIVPANPREFREQLKEIYKKAYQNLGKYAYHSEKAISTYLNWLRRRAGEGFFVAFLDGKAVGFIAVDAHWFSYEGKRIGEIHELVVAPESQGLGVGKELLLTGLNFLRTKGHQEFELWVGEENRKAKEFYQRFSFQECGKWFQWVRMVAEAAPESPACKEAQLQEKSTSVVPGSYLS